MAGNEQFQGGGGGAKLFVHFDNQKVPLDMNKILKDSFGKKLLPESVISLQICDEHGKWIDTEDVQIRVFVNDKGITSVCPLPVADTQGPELPPTVKRQVMLLGAHEPCQITDERVQLLLASCSEHGFKVEYDPPGSGNRCFYRCLGESLKLPEDDVINKVENYLLEHHTVKIRNEEGNDVEIDLQSFLADDDFPNHGRKRPQTWREVVEALRGEMVTHPVIVSAALVFSIQINIFSWEGRLTKVVPASQQPPHKEINLGYTGAHYMLLCRGTTDSGEVPYTTGTSGFEDDKWAFSMDTAPALSTIISDSYQTISDGQAGGVQRTSQSGNKMQEVPRVRVPTESECYSWGHSTGSANKSSLILPAPLSEALKKYLMSLAIISSLGNKVTSMRVGCVFVDSAGKVLALGFNWYPRLIKEREGTKGLANLVLHAERRTIIHNQSEMFAGSTVFVTMFPCLECARWLREVGVARVYYYVYRDGYKESKTYLMENGILLSPYPKRLKERELLEKNIIKLFEDVNKRLNEERNKNKKELVWWNELRSKTKSELKLLSQDQKVFLLIAQFVSTFSEDQKSQEGYVLTTECLKVRVIACQEKLQGAEKAVEVDSMPAIERAIVHRPDGNASASLLAFSTHPPTRKNAAYAVEAKIKKVYFLSPSGIDPKMRSIWEEAGTVLVPVDLPFGEVSDLLKETFKEWEGKQSPGFQERPSPPSSSRFSRSLSAPCGRDEGANERNPMPSVTWAADQL